MQPRTGKSLAETPWTYRTVAGDPEQCPESIMNPYTWVRGLFFAISDTSHIPQPRHPASTFRSATRRGQISARRSRLPQDDELAASAQGPLTGQPLRSPLGSIGSAPAFRAQSAGAGGFPSQGRATVSCPHSRTLRRTSPSAFDSAPQQRATAASPALPTAIEQSLV
jgi:hypothetical protein